MTADKTPYDNSCRAKRVPIGKRERSVPGGALTPRGPADTPGGTDMETLPTCHICQQPTTPDDDCFGTAHTTCVRRLLDSSSRRR